MRLTLIGFLRCRARTGLTVLAIAAAISSGSTGLAPALAEANQCWSQAALAHRDGEQLIHKNVPAAIVRPPRMQNIPPQSAAGGRIGAVRRVELPAGSKKLVAITFDLCEQPHEIAGYQGDIVDFLRAQNVKATFFAGGKWLLTHAERAEQLMSDPLFEVGNHSWEHRNLRVISGPAMLQEISAPLSAYQTLRADLKSKNCKRPGDPVLVGERVPAGVKLFRFPYGACDVKSLEAVDAAGLTAVQWDVSAGDPWQGVTGPIMVKQVLAHVRPGSIVIFHANGRGWHTFEALPEIIGKLKQRGFEFVTVSELMRAGTPVVDSRCYDARPGDTDKYDRVVRGPETHGEGQAAVKKRAPWSPWPESSDGGWKTVTEPN
jgi:peptidoglycan/xylan/chitin deacetylase (PgdA/CDA1 family)